MSLLGRLAAVILGLALLAWATTGEAVAHASLVSAEPADGAVIETAPSVLTLRFNEDARPLVARLIRPDGRQELLRDLRGGGSVLTIGLPAGLSQGTHIVSWRITSQDGHPIAGASLFSVGAETSMTPLPASSDSTVRAGLWLARLFLAIGMALGVGGVAFAAFFADGKPAAGPIIGGSLVAGLMALPVFVGFQGLDALGLPLTGLLEIETWRSGLLGTAYGHTAFLTAAAFLVAGAARQQGGRLLAAVALLLAGAAVAASGHASSAAPQLLTRPTVLLHVVAVCLWIGALVPLAFSLRAGNSGIPALLLFSSVIPAMLVLLLVTGIGLAIVQLGGIDGLLGSAYGRILVAKLGLIALLLGLAAINRYRLTMPAAAGEAAARRRLVRSISVELGLAVLILGVVGLWRFTPPPRAMAAVPQSPAQTLHVEGNELSAELTLKPSRVGPVIIEVADLRRRGEPIRPVEVEIELGKPSFGIGPFLRKAQPTGDSRWSAGGFVLPMDGFWVVRMKVLVSDFESVTLTDLFDVPGG